MDTTLTNPKSQTPPAVGGSTTSAPAPEHPLLKGTATLLEGAPGSGKTYSIPTLIEAGLEVFVLVTEPGGEESLLDSMRDRNLSLDKLHYHYIAPAAPAWSDLQDMAKKINTMNYEDLTKLKSGVAKRGYGQFYEMLSTLQNFTCDHCGEEFGGADTWDAKRALVIDSLSGVNTMAWNMTVGAKPAAHQGEWGVAMNAIEAFLNKLTGDLRCFLVLTAHVERELDEVQGGTKIMVSSLGRKLAPKIPRNFSDVIYSYREGDQYYWSTTTAQVDLKTRSLPLSDKIEPSFGAIVKAWQTRQAQT